ncbi:VOC family protein [Aeromonas media]|uniref:VOC family protein n=1 Tax=Aeromonas media TaxID=651 RepID=UPI0038CF7FCB
MNIAIHFEIPVQDLERAIRFYEGVFEIALERVHIDDNEMALFPLLDGVLAKGRVMCLAWTAPGSISR